MNLKSGIAKFSVEDSILLLVATVNEIKLLIVSKGDSHSLRVQQSEVQPVVYTSNQKN